MTKIIYDLFCICICTRDIYSCNAFSEKLKFSPERCDFADESEEINLDLVWYGVSKPKYGRQGMRLESSIWPERASAHDLNPETKICKKPFRIQSLYQILVCGKFLPFEMGPLSVVLPSVPKSPWEPRALEAAGRQPTFLKLGVSGGAEPPQETRSGAQM